MLPIKYLLGFHVSKCDICHIEELYISFVSELVCGFFSMACTFCKTIEKDNHMGSEREAWEN